MPRNTIFTYFLSIEKCKLIARNICRELIIHGESSGREANSHKLMGKYNYFMLRKLKRNINLMKNV
jgi:hypothetical protein